MNDQVGPSGFLWQPALPVNESKIRTAAGKMAKKRQEPNAESFAKKRET